MSVPIRYELRREPFTGQAERNFSGDFPVVPDYGWSEGSLESSPEADTVDRSHVRVKPTPCHLAVSAACSACKGAPPPTDASLGWRSPERIPRQTSHRPEAHNASASAGRAGGARSESRRPRSLVTIYGRTTTIGRWFFSICHSLPRVLASRWNGECSPWIATIGPTRGRMGPPRRRGDRAVRSCPCPPGSRTTP